MFHDEDDEDDYRRKDTLKTDFQTDNLRLDLLYGLFQDVTISSGVNLGLSGVLGYDASRLPLRSRFPSSLSGCFRESWDRANDRKRSRGIQLLQKLLPPFGSLFTSKIEGLLWSLNDSINPEPSCKLPFWTPFACQRSCCLFLLLVRRSICTSLAYLIRSAIFNSELSGSIHLSCHF